MKRLRISSISYLNTAPLMWDFEHGDAGKDFEISYTVPSLCAAALQEGSADIGIIPAAAYATISDLSILPGVAIASRRAVRSILLVSKVALSEISSVALDSSSLTSAALVKILFQKLWKTKPAFSTEAPDLEKMLSRNHAALLIGDPALRVDRSRFRTYDLAEEWIKFTGKPFVFAFWAVRYASLANLTTNLDLAAVFQRSRNHGLLPVNREKIVKAWAPKVGISESAVRNYLTHNIHYELDSACLEGLQLFYRYADECKIFPRSAKLHFLETSQRVAG
jgi:chorismate dehydratase